MKKTIILGMPKDFYLTEWFVKNLQYCGFEVTDISFNTRDFKYKNIFERINNFTRKSFAKDNSFKSILKFKNHEKKIYETLDRIEQADYALLIRPDIYPPEFLGFLKTKTHKLIAYQWDGIDRFPYVKNIIPLFDKFFVFDLQDFSKYEQRFENLRHTTNFYFDLPELIQPIVPSGIETNLFYLGSYSKSRLTVLESLLKFVKNESLRNKIIFYSTRKFLPRSKAKDIEITGNKLSYLQNIQSVKQCAALIDLRFKAHNGLSFRPFEALCFEKKLITDNRSIRQSDFYNSDNIFILGQDNENDLDNFLKTPYRKIDEKIRNQYCFTNWIAHLLGTGSLP